MILNFIWIKLITKIILIFLTIGKNIFIKVYLVERQPFNKYYNLKRLNNINHLKKYYK